MRQKEIICVMWYNNNFPVMQTSYLCVDMKHYEKYNQR